MPGSVLLLSRHDYRTDLRASIHFLADALTGLFDEVRFISVAFSPLIRRLKDARHDSALTANTWQTVRGVRCFLWSMPWHPISGGGRVTRWFTSPAFDLWAHWPCTELDSAAAGADVIIVQSGPAAGLIARLRRCAPRAKIVYRAADLLDTADVHPRVQAMLDRDADKVDRVVVVARAMIRHFQRFGERVRFVPHGIDPAPYDRPTASPYAGGRNIVSIGSMLFDASVIQIAAEFFPDDHFHLIGTPEGHRFPANVREYGCMPFADTIPYLQHADVGVAAYADAPESEYLVDSSLKLMQFGYLGVPAVCPTFAVGDKPVRAGYEPGRSASIREAFGLALAMPRGVIRTPVLSWRAVVEAMLDGLVKPARNAPASPVSLGNVQ